MYLTHPARPIHGGPLDIAITKPLFLDPDIYGDRRAELKLNGFRVEADRHEKILYNRHGEVLSISSEFSEALDLLHALPKRFPRHMDCEGLERRHGYGRAEIRDLCHNGELSERETNMYSSAAEERRKARGPAVAQVRVTYGATYMAMRVIVLTDKPQKPFPAEVWGAYTQPTEAELIHA